MDRVIKFKAIQSQGTMAGRWLVGSLLYNPLVDPGYEAMIMRPGESSIYVDKDTVCQYIDLTDRDGKDIYEGDILEVYNWGGRFAREQPLLGITSVEWSVDDGGFRYVDYLGAEDYYDQFRNVKVVGNIYDPVKEMPI